MLGLHGRYSSTPARGVTWSTDWSGDERIVTVSGRVREVSALGPVLESQRTITTTLGSNSLLIEDVVTNLGASQAPNMFRYHVNLGFPMIDHESRIEFDLEPAHLQDPPAHDGMQTWNTISRPSAPVAEQLFITTMNQIDKEASVTVVNPSSRPSLRLRWSGDTLPLLLVWKQPTRRTYVTSLEPSNCRDGGRAAERASGTLASLEAGEERRYWLELSAV